MALSDENKKKLLEYLTEFARQPFIEAKRVTPALFAKMFSSEITYVYWINSRCKEETGLRN
jgi:hypothetical protein